MESISLGNTAWPVLTFEAPVAIDLGSQILELITQEPAPTDGDVAIWLPSANVLIMGGFATPGASRRGQLGAGKA
jgi:glyoxylase-like metal-dependent hydrolase (beta-lactamase superfamily II)